MDSTLKIRYRDRDYTMKLEACGRLSYNRYNPEWHYHSVYHLILLSAGRHYLDLGKDRTLLLEKNTLFLLNPLQRHRFRHLAGEEFEHTTILWRLLDSAGKAARFPLQPLLQQQPENVSPFQSCRLSDPEANRACELHQSLLDAMRRGGDPAGWNLKIFHLWYSWLELLAARTLPVAEPVGRRWIDEIEMMIQRSYIDPAFCGKSIASSLGRTQNYLNAIYQQATGESISTVLRRKRLESATQLLTVSEHFSVAEVAERCGFTSASYFTRAFQREYDLTPLRYRHASCRKREYFNLEVNRVISPNGGSGLPQRHILSSSDIVHKKRPIIHKESLEKT